MQVIVTNCQLEGTKLVYKYRRQHLDRAYLPHMGDFVEPSSKHRAR